MTALLYCSFCGKTSREVLQLIAGPTVFICDECVEACVPIIAEAKKYHRIRTDPMFDEYGPVVARAS